MDVSKMKNMIILKDLPSNIIDEAIVILNKNQKVKNLEIIENKSEKFLGLKKDSNDKNYIINEAEMIISNYISHIEQKNNSGNKEVLSIKKKYKNLKLLTIAIFVICIISIIF